MLLLGYSVLIGEDVLFAVARWVLVEAVFARGGGLVVLIDAATEGFGVGGVNCRDDGEVVLVFVEVGGGGGEGVIQGIA